MITGRVKLDTLEIIEVDIDPKISIERNLLIGSLVLWNDGLKGKIFKKSGVNLNDYDEINKVKFHALAVGQIGSSIITQNQNFKIDLSSFNFEIGDVVRLGNALVRGDLSKDSDDDSQEYFDVGFGSVNDVKARMGLDNYDDLGVFRTDGSLIDRTYILTDIGGGVAGLEVFVSPSDNINFSPDGMPNGWFWQLKIDVLVI